MHLWLARLGIAFLPTFLFWPFWLHSLVWTKIAGLTDATNHGLDQRTKRFWSLSRAAETWSSLSAAWKHFSRWFWFLVGLQEDEASYHPLLNNRRRKRTSVVPKSDFGSVDATDYVCDSCITTITWWSNVLQTTSWTGLRNWYKKCLHFIWLGRIQIYS